MEALGAIAIIMVCGLFADNMLTKGKVKELRQRVKDLEALSDTK